MLDSQGRTVLQLACAKGQTGVVQELLTLGCPLSAPSQSMSAMVWAAAEGHVDVVKLLVAHNQPLQPAVFYAVWKEEEEGGKK